MKGNGPRCLWISFQNKHHQLMHCFITNLMSASLCSKTVFPFAINMIAIHIPWFSDGPWHSCILLGKGSKSVRNNLLLLKSMGTLPPVVYGDVEGLILMTNGISHIFTGTCCLWMIPKRLFRQLNLDANIASWYSVLWYQKLLNSGVRYLRSAGCPLLLL